MALPDQRRPITPPAMSIADHPVRAANWPKAEDCRIRAVGTSLSRCLGKRRPRFRLRVVSRMGHGSTASAIFIGRRRLAPEMAERVKADMEGFSR